MNHASQYRPRSATQLITVLAASALAGFGFSVVAMATDAGVMQNSEPKPSLNQLNGFNLSQGKSSSLEAAPRDPTNYSSTILSTKIQSMPARDCNANQSCTLGDVKFVEYKKLFRFDGEADRLASHFTDTRFVITTKSVSDLESYGVVQFIRGCMFRNRLVNGVVQKELSISRDEFGQIVPFQHKGWEIDNDNDDPLISAEPGHGRFALLRWNKDASNINTEGSTYYANIKPPHSRVFLSDMPGPAALMPTLNVADNATLNFRTCIFKIADLPTHTDPKGSNVDASKALWCAEWSHNYVWNFKTQQTEEPTSFDPICEAN